MPDLPEAVNQTVKRLAAVASSEVLATCTRAIAGKFCAFDEGEIVKVKWDDGITCVLERVEWKGSLVPLTNQLAGVPRTMLRFHPQT